MDQNMRKINTNELTANTTVFVTGLVSFSHIRRRYDGDELKERIRRERERGSKYPTTVPHTELSLIQAAVVPANQQAWTLEEMYIYQRLYTSRNHPERGNNYSAKSTGPLLPWIGVRENGNVVRQLEPDEIKGELDNGLKVTAVIRIFKTSQNNGVALDGVIVEEPIRFYTGAAGASLDRYGLVLQAAKAGRETEAKEAAASYEQPVPEPEPQMGTNPFMTQPAQQAPAGWAQPASQPQTPAQPVPPMNPPQAPQAPDMPQMQSGGIRYNPDYDPGNPYR